MPTTPPASRSVRLLHALLAAETAAVGSAGVVAARGLYRAVRRVREGTGEDVDSYLSAQYALVGDAIGVVLALVVVLGLALALRRSVRSGGRGARVRILCAQALLLFVFAKALASPQAVVSWLGALGIVVCLLTAGLTAVGAAQPRLRDGRRPYAPVRGH